MEQYGTRKPNMFGGSTKPNLLASKADQGGSQLGGMRSKPAGSELRSSVGEDESSFRPGSQLGDGKNRPFGKFSMANRPLRPESKTKLSSIEEPAPVLEGISKPKVNFTGEIKTKPKKKEDNFFDEPMPDEKMKKQAKPDLMKSRLPGERNIEDNRVKEKNFFEDDIDDVPVPVQELNAKPNLGKPRVGTSMHFQPSEPKEQSFVKEQKADDPYEEFEVLSHEQGRL